MAAEEMFCQDVGHSEGAPGVHLHRAEEVVLQLDGFFTGFTTLELPQLVQRLPEAVYDLGQPEKKVVHRRQNGLRQHLGQHRSN